MGYYGVGEVGTGTGERVDRTVIKTSLTLGPIAGSGAGGGGRSMGMETGVKNEWKFRVFLQVESQLFLQSSHALDLNIC